MRERRNPNEPKDPRHPNDPKPVQEPSQQPEKKLAPSHKNKAAWIMPAKPGQTVADLSQEERIRSARIHEQKWKQRTSKATGGHQNF